MQPIHEQVEEKSNVIAIKATKLTARLLAKAMLSVLQKARQPHAKRGQQSIRSLTKQGATLTNIEISGDNIGSFTRVARKYNVSFALKKDAAQDPPKWYVFFKSKDVDSLTAAFKEYSREALGKTAEKPSLYDALEKSKELASQISPPVRNRNVGGHEL